MWLKRWGVRSKKSEKLKLYLAFRSLNRTFAVMKPSFMIAAPTSGAGKTTIARGLLALFSSKGMKVQPFKCGPDYIDTKFHELVCGRPSINLDTFMASPEHVKDLFAHYGSEADVCVAEGMMGLFDGYDRDLGSSAEIAKTLAMPIVLVVDAKRTAYSMAALLSGFVHFRKDVCICGVIFNRVGSKRHEEMLRQVCDDIGLDCLGMLPNHPDLEQGSRYLGLDFSEMPEAQTLTNLLEENVDWRRLLTLGTERAFQTTSESVPKNSPRLVVARNQESFSFVYQETLDAFREVVTFDPETEVPCLEDDDLLYLPGGYPEKHLEVLSQNDEARTAIRQFAENGGHVVAECGGMMYLCRSIVCNEGEFSMCGVLPYTITARKQDRKLSLGYRRFMLDGKEYRGHEFHYTQFLGETPQSITQVFNAKGEPVSTPVMRYKNVLASYTHLYHIL